MAHRSDLVIASLDPALRRRLVRGLRREPGIGRVLETQDQVGLGRTLARLTSPVLLLDFPIRGLEDLHAIPTVAASAQVILLVDSPDDSAAVEALKAGARGYCARSTDVALLRRAIALVREGEIWVGRRVILQLIDELTALHRRRARTARARFARLTKRESEIGRLVATGASNKELAGRLAITEKTVKAHLTSIFQKLGLSSRLHLALYTLEARPPE
ncbi:MAG: response regulator transcription factor [Candidatus Rokubacteria bacterium]|nr:response regulator transcription factor [Candidatus Rokubacteria bacterium]